MTLTDLQTIYTKTYMDWKRLCEEYKAKKNFVSREQLYVIQVRRQNMKRDLNNLKAKIETHPDYGKTNFFKD